MPKAKGDNKKSSHMRQIEKNMLKAIADKKEYCNTNTCVLVNRNGIFVKLYDTIIFAKVNGKKYYSDGGFNTATTSSRLRALGADYSTNKERNNAKLTNQGKMINLYFFGKMNPATI